MSEDLKDIGDPRVEFMANYILKTLKIKSDKWNKMYVIDENKTMILEFVEKAEQNLLVFNMTPAGALTVSYEYPNQFKTKAIYFAKKNKENITKDSMKDAVLYGDLSIAPVDQLSAILDEVIRYEISY